MVIRQRGDITQIGVLEDNVLVEHYVARESQTSLIGNVYLGRVQNVLPSMEAAFIDIGKGRNAVLYAGEVNWSALGHKEGQARKIESVLSSGQSILVQVTKDPIGHKGARLTSQVSLAGRFLVYVPDGTTSGISRKLPDTERNRLKTLLKDIVPDTAGVIVRTAAEGASEDELTRDVERLKARWEDIEKKSANKGAGAQLLYGEPDLTLKVVRDLFTEDFAQLIIEGDDAWETVQSYVVHVAPDLEERLERYEPKKDVRPGLHRDQQRNRTHDPPEHSGDEGACEAEDGHRCENRTEDSSAVRIVHARLENRGEAGPESDRRDPDDPDDDKTHHDLGTDEGRHEEHSVEQPEQDARDAKDLPWRHPAGDAGDKKTPDKAPDGLRRHEPAELERSAADHAVHPHDEEHAKRPLPERAKRGKRE
jgi:hypothetical protein